MVRARRPYRPHPSLLRRIAVALSMLLVIGLLARGHVFQALGIPFGCEHPVAETLAQQGDHSGSADDEDCPPDCHRCPCGQIPMMPPSLDVLAAVRLDPYELADTPRPDTPGRALPHRLDRPPRRALS